MMTPEAPYSYSYRYSCSTCDNSAGVPTVYPEYTPHLPTYEYCLRIPPTASLPTAYCTVRVLPTAYCSLPPTVLPPASCLLPPASCLLPPASCLLPPASCLLLPPAPCLLPPASCLLPPASCLLPPAYCLLCLLYCLLPTAYCLQVLPTVLPTVLLPTVLPTAYCLRTAYCLLPTYCCIMHRLLPDATVPASAVYCTVPAAYSTTVPTLDATAPIYIYFFRTRERAPNQQNEPPRPRPNVAMLGRVPPKGLI